MSMVSTVGLRSVVGAGAGVFEVESLKEICKGLGQVRDMSEKELDCPEYDALEDELKRTHTYLYELVHEFCVRHRECLEKKHGVYQGGYWLCVVFYAARVGQLDELGEYITGTDVKVEDWPGDFYFAHECVSHLFWKRRREYDVCIEGQPECVKGVDVGDFEHEVGRVLERLGFASIEDLNEPKFYGRNIAYYVKEGLIKNPVIRGYLLRKGIEVGVDGNPIFESDLEGRLVETCKGLLNQYTPFPGFIGVDLMSRYKVWQGKGVVVDGLDSIVVEELVTPRIAKTLGLLRKSNSDVYKYVHVVRETGINIRAFSFRLIDMAIGFDQEVKIEEEGVHYVVLNGFAQRPQWVDESHALTYVGVIHKWSRREAQVISIIGLNTVPYSMFNVEEEVALNGRRTSKTEIPVIWANQEVQIEREDGSCAFYTMQIMEAFMRALADCKDDLDAHVLALKETAPDNSREAKRKEVGDYLAQEVRKYLPGYFTDAGKLREWEGKEGRKVSVVKKRLQVDRWILKLILLKQKAIAS